MKRRHVESFSIHWPTIASIYSMCIEPTDHVCIWVTSLDILVKLCCFLTGQGSQNRHYQMVKRENKGMKCACHHQATIVVVLLLVHQPALLLQSFTLNLLGTLFTETSLTLLTTHLHC